VVNCGLFVLVSLVTAADKAFDCVLKNSENKYCPRITKAEN
jgi:hypothetical protein